MEFGCWIEDERMPEIAEQLGCLEEARGFPIDWRVRFALFDKIGVKMRFKEVFTGITDKEVGDPEDGLYSFGSNYDLGSQSFPKGEILVQLLKILGVQRSDFRWWVSTDDWKWKHVNLERERWLKECNARDWIEWADRAVEIHQGHLRRAAEKTNEQVAASET